MANTFFMGGSTAKGFYTTFQSIINQPGYFTYILKGGPGTGKSTLMKKVAEQFSSHAVDLYVCSSDIHSLDAVVLSDVGAVIVDGTAPHVFNADFPGVSQCLVDLGAFWTRARLKEYEPHIRRCFAENSAYHRRARHYIAALSNVVESVYVQAASEADPAGISHAVMEITADFPAYMQTRGTHLRKTFAAVTTEGYFTQPVPSGCQVIGIHDHRYAAGSMLLAQLRDWFLVNGYTVETGECLLFPDHQPEHIRIPQLRIQFSLINDLNGLNDHKDYSCEPLYLKPGNDEELFRARELTASLLEEAAYSIRSALRIHDSLESYYIDSLDFTGLDRITAQLIEEIAEMPALLQP